jgi:hypothetical protein
LAFRVRVKTYPGVCNAYQHLIRISVPSSDCQFSRPIIYFAHRLDTVHGQVEYDLLQLNSIA